MVAWLESRVEPSFCHPHTAGEAELVQATNENIREYQEAVEDVTTEEIANFTSALTVAFELLKTSRSVCSPSVCLLSTCLLIIC